MNTIVSKGSPWRNVQSLLLLRKIIKRRDESAIRLLKQRVTGRETRQPTVNPAILRRLPQWRIIVAASRYSREKESGDSRRDGVS